MHIKRASHPTRRALYRKQQKRSLNTSKFRRSLVVVCSETPASNIRFDPLSLRTKDQRHCESFETDACGVALPAPTTFYGENVLVVSVSVNPELRLLLLVYLKKLSWLTQPQSLNNFRRSWRNLTPINA